MPRAAAKTKTTAREIPVMRLERVPIGDVHDVAGVRSVVEVDDGFVQSVRTNDIIQPLVVAPNGAGYRLVAGRRRLEAARRAGLTTVPVIVREDLGEDHAASALVAEIVENIQRADLTPAEEAAAYEQLALIGADELTIAAATGSDVERVGWGLRLAKAPTVRKAMEKAPALTLQHAAAIAEFEDDEKTVAHLAKVAQERPADFDHSASRLRQKRDEARARAEAIAKLEKAGVSILRPRGGYNGYTPDSAKAVRLSWLYEDGKQLTAATHRKCPGHAAFLPDLDQLADSGIGFDSATGLCDECAGGDAA